MTEARPQTRIQKKNRETILDAALDVFSSEGFRGATLDQIASAASLSKPNVLYYFSSKEAIYTELLSELLDTWLDPLRALDPKGDPIDELVAYMRRKFEMSRQYPRESRLFANEIVQGAPRIVDEINGPLKSLVDKTAKLIQSWIHAGRLAPVDPYHLVFSIWATTQHYADFDVQVRGILTPEGDSHLDDAEAFLVTLYTRTLTPTSN
ncbi:TetR family transcriptional regulator C-terminal domain-containing protein [Boseongicola aestuarii]|uniref:HTH-type transcriptional regulator RutR n=1 Tax=Boseongicola aestuarii TaxID=1470561 RepID=A0A238J3H6_9RHOB|nr:TetR family transcriptional regulator C-terminal domain-containing protein [Boseongicola aestuarii]SMX25206.1 HTH-type transcriptional regulator RutR [Boseongicola aestuarii]